MSDIGVCLGVQKDDVGVSRRNTYNGEAWFSVYLSLVFDKHIVLLFIVAFKIHAKIHNSIHNSEVSNTQFTQSLQQPHLFQFIAMRE
jgi:hypothetical protein